MELFRNEWELGANQLQDTGGLLARGYSSQLFNNLQSEILVVHIHVPWGE